MSFLELTPDKLDSYCSFLKSVSGFWLFQHIPKTAGSSVAAEIGRNIGSYVNIMVDYSAPLASYGEMLDRAVENFLAFYSAGGVKCASGHLTRKHVDKIAAAIPDVRIFTFVRHPVKRVISEYVYCITPAHPDHQRFRTRFPSLQSFVECPAEQNKMTFHLTGRTTAPWDEVATRLASRFSFIGLQERYDESMLLMSSCAWRPALPVFRERVRAQPGNGVDELTPQLWRRIEELNGTDLRLFNEVDSVYQRLAGQIWQIAQSHGLANCPDLGMSP